MRTYDLDAALWITSSLDSPHCFVDAVLTSLDYLVGVVLVPSITSLHFPAGCRNVWAGLTLAEGNTEEIRSGAGLQCWHNDRKL